MPDVYRDPAYGDEKTSFTHYAGLVGPHSFFPPEGAKQPSNVGTTAPLDKGGRSAAEITDGTTNSLSVVPVSPDRKIPWTKPDDITVGPVFPGLGAPDGIATPYTLGLQPGAPGVAPVLYADGHVEALVSTINPVLLRALTTVNGGEVIDPRSIPRDPLPNFRPGRTLKIRVSGATATATVE
jgi:prepilin-type processing-associated H-X9-DG protein